MTARSAYENIMVEETLKESIIAQAQLLYSKEHSLDRIWKVVFKTNFDCWMIAHVIVYKDSRGVAGYDEVARGAPFAERKDALEDLLEELLHFTFDDQNIVFDDDDDDDDDDS